MQPLSLAKKNLEYFNSLKKIKLFYYQGSQQSTDVGIERVFKNAKKNKSDEQIPLVFFDEIGLAELSPQNPLKVLHKYLDYSTDDKAQDDRMNLLLSDIKDSEIEIKENNDDNNDDKEKKDVDKKTKKVIDRDIAFVGISNWTIDVSKMNRNIYLSRPSPGQDDLFQTAEAILKYQINKLDNNSLFIDHYLPPLARTVSESYYHFWKSQEKYSHKNFHSLRDFYWLLKYLGTQIVKNLKGNLGGKKEDFWKMNYTGIDKNFAGIYFLDVTLNKTKKMHINF